MPRILPRVLAGAALASLLAVGLAVPASAAPVITYVVPADLSNVNVSAALTKWDSPTGSAIATVPPAGTKWALDIENKPLGSYDITADGLALDVSVVPAPQKVRFQYYIGSGGYPAVDAQNHTLDDMLAAPLSWDLKLLSGDRTTYGPVFQVQLQKLLPGAAGYARVTVQTVWSPADGTHDLQNGLWFANTNIYAAGYPANTTTYAPTGDAILNRAGSGPGVSAQVLADNFGDFEVVSFGPNLGRDFGYSFAFQNLTVFGHTFAFVEQLPVAPSPLATSSSSSSGSTGGSSGATTFTPTLVIETPAPDEEQADEELPTLPLPEENSTPSDDDETEVDPVAAADTNADPFPIWLLLLGIGSLVLMLAIVLWILRRRAI